ncbi:MAG: hypothetical protein MJE68_09320, partial [Proteobacteria bacterium]|nr:hypothetical protein [Pseudomonadota bacterium]
LTVFTAMIMRMCYELANMWPTYRYIHTNVHKYSDFLVVLISVELAQACPNYMYEKIQGLSESENRCVCIVSDACTQRIHFKPRATFSQAPLAELHVSSWLT